MPRGLPVRSAGPETSSTSSSSWNASPIARAEAARARRPSPGRRRAAPEPAGGLEQPRGLQVAALAGSARGVDVASQASRALQQLAARERRRGVGERAHRVRAAASAASSANARENSRSPVAVAVARPRAANTVGPPAAQRRRVEHVVVDERRHVDAARPRAARRARAGSSRAGARAEEHEQRPQPLAAGGERRAGVLAPSSAPWPRGHLGQARLDALEQRRRACAPPASSTARELRLRRVVISRRASRSGSR